jgi:L-seryl-tRNA(Ser) seleniumtransferase
MKRPAAVYADTAARHGKSAMTNAKATIPAVDRLLRAPEAGVLIGEHGTAAVTEAVRGVLADLRADLDDERSGAPVETEPAVLLERVAGRLADEARATLRPVFNLTGTVLHTNLGRAPLPPEAISAMAEAAAGPANLEFDLATGRRGDRDVHVEDLICRLTGAEAATVVNNNAAAVLLVLNTLARGKEVPVSRGELIEIGGAFRMPEIMARAGSRLREVGTTNRTHLKDYAAAIGPKTGLLMKVHTSNYRVEGFTAEVSERDLGALAREHDLALVVDLGSGMLVDMERFGLPHEPTPKETLEAGADIVTFSGDKLLGGPQAGLICGSADLIKRLKGNPMKRAMRLDKVTMAGLAAVLRLYRDPERLGQRLPALRLLSRPVADIRALAGRLAPKVAAVLGDGVAVTVIDCQSQIGSGSLPVDLLPSAGLALTPKTGKRGAGKALANLARDFRRLPRPAIGRIHDGALILDLRCLEDEDAFADQLSGLGAGAGGP